MDIATTRMLCIGYHKITSSKTETLLECANNIEIIIQLRLG